MADPASFFSNPATIAQKQYEAPRMFYLDGVPGRVVAERFGYSYRGFTTICSHFRANLKQGKQDDLFFKPVEKGRKTSKQIDLVKESTTDMRKKFYSIQDIKVALDAAGHSASESSIYNILRSEGFGRLPRRLKTERNKLDKTSLTALKTETMEFTSQMFKSASAGILCLLPIIEHYGIRKAIENSMYPQTKVINRLSSILSFIALKASNNRRYTADDLWCSDRGQGLFAGLNVLPKASWFTSYSHRVTSEMNRNFLRSLHALWLNNDLLCDTSNLDFTTIPYWGDSEHLENNWSGKRGKAMASMLAVIAQDPDSGIIDYSDANIKHKNQSDVILEYLDFYQVTCHGRKELRYLVSDSKFTNYENLNHLNKENVKFLTIRRRGKSIVECLKNLPKSEWKSIRVQASGNKKRTIKVIDEFITLRGYDGAIRQVCITGHGKIKPAIIITNETDLKVEDIVRKYSRRWIVEKGISEQIEFFHLNRVSSSMVIKVDFDLTMSILTHNIFRLFAMQFPRYKHLSDQTIYEKFLVNVGDIEVNQQIISVNLKKKRQLPALLQMTNSFDDLSYPHLNNLPIHFSGASYT